jgi:long-chain acyl-CoA synthetase
VDRLKNLVKLKGGEYVSIEFMETTYAQSAFVNGSNGGVMCYADGDMDRPVALVQVAGKELESWAREHNVQFTSLEELCKDPLAINMVTTELNDIGASVICHSTQKKKESSLSKP